MSDFAFAIKNQYLKITFKKPYYQPIFNQQNVHEHKAIEFSFIIIKKNVPAFFSDIIKNYKSKQYNNQNTYGLE